MLRHNTAHFRDASITYHVLQAGSANTLECEVARPGETAQLISCKGVPALLLIQGAMGDAAVSLIPLWCFEMGHPHPQAAPFQSPSNPVRKLDEEYVSGLRTEYCAGIALEGKLARLIKARPLLLPDEE